ncbi:MAG: hypothetical protein U0168_20430 [Nannocystaceae bacterium]
MVVVAGLAACGPEVDPDIGDSGSSDAGDATASSSASASVSSSSAGTSASTTTSSGDASSSSPPPPEGGEIGEGEIGEGSESHGGDCSCCESSMTVFWGGRQTDFAVVLQRGPDPIAVDCPRGTVEGLSAEASVVCGPGGFTLHTDGLVDVFTAGAWTLQFADAPQPEQVTATCDFWLCDCNCTPSNCSIDLTMGVDDG